MIVKQQRTFLITCIIYFTIFLSKGFAGNTEDTLNIIHASDVHLLFSLEECNPIIFQNRKHYINNKDSLVKFFNSIPKKNHANAVIFTGDNIDYYQAEGKLGEFVENQVERFRAYYDLSPVPLYLTLGNHDIDTYSINNGDSLKIITQNNADQSRASWIRNIPCFYNGTYYEKIFQVHKTKYHFIFLDNGYMHLDSSRKIDKIQYDWLNEKVLRAGSDPVVLFFHIYFHVGDKNGDGIFFNKNGPVNWPTLEQCSKGLLKIINENQNIKALVVGHGHKNAFEKIHFPSGNNIYQIETGSLKDGIDNWRLIQLTNDNIIISFPGSTVPEIIMKSEGEI